MKDCSKSVNRFRITRENNVRKRRVSASSRGIR